MENDEQARMMEKTRDAQKVVGGGHGWIFRRRLKIGQSKTRKVPSASYSGPSCVLTTANYVARKYGVRAAMPRFIAKKLCPELVLVKQDFKKYIQASRESVMFAQYNPDYIAGSLDERTSR